MIKSSLKTEIVDELLASEKLMMSVCLLIEVKLQTFMRWLKGNKSDLTHYDTLRAISEVLELEIDELIEVEEFSNR